MRGLNIKSVAIFFTFVLSILNTNSLYSATFCVGTAEDLSNALTTAATNNEDDTIKILQGIYYGSFFYDGHYENNTIEILGGYSNNCTERLNDYSKTILDSEGGGTVLRLLGNYYSTANFNFIVDGLTIQNGKNVERWSGGGIRISGRFPSTISNCKFFNNTSHGGGGILIASRELNIENCIFLNNTSHDGGGIAIPNAAYIDVKNCQFIENQAEDGGGIFLGENVYVVITACTFSNNISQYGGGVANWCPSTEISICYE